MIVEYIWYDRNCLFAGILSAPHSNYTQYGLKHSQRPLRIRKTKKRLGISDCILVQAKHLSADISY
jgi:hypothetical protein